MGVVSRGSKLLLASAFVTRAAYPREKSYGATRLFPAQISGLILVFVHAHVRMLRPETEAACNSLHSSVLHYSSPALLTTRVYVTKHHLSASSREYRMTKLRPTTSQVPRTARRLSKYRQPFILFDLIEII